MKKRSALFYYILVFVLVQIAWFSLLGLWIFWYVSNYIVFEQVGDSLSPQMMPDSTNVFALVSGLILLVVISIGMSLIFVYLNRQMNLTKLYNDFIANVSHELKSPLSSIQLYLETLKSRKIPAVKQDEFISLMLKDTGRLNTLINSILYISGIEQKKNVRKYPHDYQIYTADSLIRELINDVTAQFNITNIVKIEAEAPCQCVIDKHWMRIVFNNLIDNAIKYSPKPVSIDVKVYSSTKYVSIEIKDQGVGISIRDQKRIFNKFERIDNQDSPNVKGTGLGLYWVTEIIRYHGGKISVFSEGKNHGTTFKIELPVYRALKKRYIKNLLKISKYRNQTAEVENG